MSIETKFEAFWTVLGQCPYDLPEEIKPFMKDALQKTGFFEVPTVAMVTGSLTSGKKKLTGYNLFMREKMAEFKAQGVPSGERMTKVGALWKASSETDKAVWKAKADGLAPTTSSGGAAPKAKKLTGYNL